MNDEEVKETIKTWRWRIAKAGMTQAKFALKARIQSSHLSRYINFRTNPSNVTFVKIEKLLQKLKV